MQENGGQLFSYFQQERNVKYLCLYTSDFINSTLNYENYIITMQDNEEYLKEYKKQGYENAPDVKSIFRIWSETYAKEYKTNGIFEEEIKSYTITNIKPKLEHLKSIDSNDIHKKRHQWATILRANTIGDKGNALNKIMNIFLCKITDEIEKPKDLQFSWAGYSADTPFNLVDRLQKLYQIGMKEYLNQDITYYSKEDIDKAFNENYKKTPSRQKIHNIFNELKYFQNGDFNFIEVHNQNLFDENFKVLLQVVLMLENVKFSDKNHSQFLGDFFESYIADMPQHEGQYFTPTPLVCFMIHSLPVFKDSKVLDFACGAGHFLSEYAKINENYKTSFLGIDKDSRLAKISTISSFMYGRQNNIKILYQNSLSLGNIEDSSVNIIISNPPYSVDDFLFTLDEDSRNDFLLFKNNKNISLSTGLIECFFIEKASKALESNGLLALVLPNSILTNNNELTQVQTNEILLRDFNIIAILKLGGATFFKTNTSPIILFAIRKDKEQNTTKANDIYEYFHGLIKENSFLQELQDENYHNFIATLESYANFRRLSLEELKQIFSASIREDSKIFELQSFKEYKSFYEVMIKKEKQEYDKKIRKKPFIPSISLQDFIKEKEAEKFLYFCYCLDSSPLIIKAPDSNDAQKKFLGYEWSTRKGYDGIHYKLKEDAKNASINFIDTPLFNPRDRFDESKISFYILQNFLQKLSKAFFRKRLYIFSHLNIHESLQGYIREERLIDLINFDSIKFDKSIALNPFTSSAQSLINPFANSKYELVRLGDLGEFIGGLWKGKKPPYVKAKIIRNTNFDLKGGLKADSEYPELEVEINQLEKRKLEYGDIIIEKSGGSNNQAVGRAVIFTFKSNEIYSFSNFTNRLRVNNKNINPFYLHLVLNYIYKLGITFSMQSGMSSLRNLDMNAYKNLQIPLPPLAIQKQIVSECEKVEKQYQTIRMSIEKYQELIKAILAKSGVIDENFATGGGIDSLVKSIESLETELDCTILFESLESPAALPPQSIETLPYNDKIEFLQALQTPLNLNALLDSIPTPPQKGWEKVRLSNTQKFSLSIGKRVLDSELQTQGTIPVYSANIKKPFGYIDKELLEDYESDSVLWGIDGDFMVGFMPKGTAFYPTDHCGILRVTSDDIVPKILSFALENEGKKVGFRREYRASLERVRGLQIPLPPLEMQEKITFAISKIEEKIQILNSSLENLQAHKNKILQNTLNLIRDV
ncbi:N-6 DNA methylase [Campylobacter avium]|uniref:N-6 DNA methylase n=2 Tax=Campylobacter avium TaxID=522485 RepID=UPI00248CD7A6|nr:N-6 DNA methylase [Campylobacter avium]